MGAHILRLVKFCKNNPCTTHFGTRRLRRPSSIELYAMTSYELFCVEIRPYTVGTIPNRFPTVGADLFDVESTRPVSISLAVSPACLCNSAFILGSYSYSCSTGGTEDKIYLLGVLPPSLFA